MSYIIVGECMNNRDMFYQNLNQGYSNPGGFIPPSGYNVINIKLMALMSFLNRWGIQIMTNLKKELINSRDKLKI